VGAIIAFLWLISRAPQSKRKAMVDVYLGGLVGGVFVGRLLHVALQWQYFVDRTNEIRRIYREGGLNWHGVVIGALFGALILARLRKVEMRPVLDNLAVALPLLALLGWWGCGTIGCAYGLPVERMADYPHGLTWAQPDIFGIDEPRFATQQLGVLLAGGLLLLALILHWRNWLSGRRLWLLLLLLSISMFMLNFLRGDFSVMLYNLRIEQWLDVGMALFAAILFIMARRTAPQYDSEQEMTTQ